MVDQAKSKRGNPFGPFIVVGAIALALFVMPFGVGVKVFRNPSGSMQPALYVGDYFIVTKWSYGYGRYSSPPFSQMAPRGRLLARMPARGDIVVFRPTPEPGRDFVKRIVGLPGDRIQMIDGVLHINDEAVGYESLGEISFNDEDGGVVRAHAYRETLPGGASYVVLDRAPDSELDNTIVFTVPDNAIFVMGDDRDNSADSRIASVVGHVPLDNLVGKVAYIIPSSQAERIE